jgi:NADPH-dependent curcumin reductase CurA
VGSVVGQIARLRGASRVIGSAGSDAKVAYLTEKLGFDAAFNYHSGPVVEQLAKAAPDGIDVFFDNVGGEQLEAAIECMNNYGRIAACGAISTYNDTEPAAGPRNLFQFVARRLTMRGFLVFEHNDRRAAFRHDVGGWLRAGQLTSDETVVEGIEQSPAAFLAMMRGANTGKMLIRL